MHEAANDYSARITTQMRKGTLEFCTLLIIASGEVYSGDIIQRLRAADQLVVEGTLYPILSRLKRDGLLAYRWEESPGGPPRKYYNLTDQGRSALEHLKAGWTSVSQSISQLTPPHA